MSEYPLQCATGRAAPRSLVPLEAHMPILCLTAELAGLNDALDLPPLLPHVCHGYSNCCVCDRCTARDRRRGESGLPIRQPWELEQAA